MSPSHQGAVIKTARLVLRPHGASDFEDVFALWADEAVTQHIYDRPQTEAEAWSRLLRYRGHWDVLEYGYWAVTDRATGRFLGDVGFANYKRAPLPELREMPEAGWVMARHAHGQGFAREAMEAALRWSDANIEAPCSWATIMVDNAASLRLAERLGFQQVATEPVGDKTRVILERKRAREA